MYLNIPLPKYFLFARQQALASSKSIIGSDGMKKFCTGALGFSSTNASASFLAWNLVLIFSNTTTGFVTSFATGFATGFVTIFSFLVWLLVFICFIFMTISQNNTKSKTFFYIFLLSDFSKHRFLYSENYIKNNLLYYLNE